MRRGGFGALLAASLVVGCGGVDVETAGSDGRGHLVLITIDTLRADHLGCYGNEGAKTPRIDALSEEAYLFERVLTPMATTLPAHTSILTGLFPLEHQILANTQHGGRPFAWKPGVLTMAQLASDAGYSTAAFVSAAPLKDHCGLDVGFDVYDQPADRQVRARATVDAAIEWIESEPSGPLFLWVHLFDPHADYDPPAAFALRRVEGAGTFIERRAMPSALESQGELYDTRETLAAYGGEVHFVDAMVGRLLDSLDSAGVTEAGTVVLTADHGEGLNQHRWLQHGLIWEEQLHVPLIIRPPGGLPDSSGRRIGGLASLVDVLPTALPFVSSELAGAFEAQASGQNLLSPAFRPRPLVGQMTGRLARKAGADGTPPQTFALTTTEWKLFHDPRGRDLLFERASDPFELEDVAAQHPDVVAELRARLGELIAEQEARAAQLGTAESTGAVDEALRADLEALGYVDD